MHRTVKSSRPSSVASTRKRGLVTAAMQEKISLRDAIKRAEEAARVTKEESLAPQKRREASVALKARVTEDKSRREKYEENDRKKIEHKRELKERDERIRLIRQREQAIRREKHNTIRQRDLTPKIDPKVKALTDHFRERVKQFERQPSPRASPRASSSDDEFLDALPPDSPELLDGLWGNIRRALGRGKTMRNKRSHHRKTHKKVKKSNKMRSRKKSRRKRSQRKRSQRKRSQYKR